MLYKPIKKGQNDMTTKKLKTPDYTRKAVKAYNDRFERINVNLDIGSKEWIKEHTGKSCNKFFVDLFHEFKKKYEETQNT